MPRRLIKKRIVALTGSPHADHALANLECGHTDKLSFELARVMRVGEEQTCWRCTEKANKTLMPLFVKKIFLKKRPKEKLKEQPTVPPDIDLKLTQFEHIIAMMAGSAVAVVITLVGGPIHGLVVGLISWVSVMIFALAVRAR